MSIHCSTITSAGSRSSAAIPRGGASLLTASLVLAIMIVPTVTAISRDVIRVVPDNQREAMLALGATRWEMISAAVLPYARPGIIGALILALGRAVGETIAATMVSAITVYLGRTCWPAPTRWPAGSPISFGEASDSLYKSALFELGSDPVPALAGAQCDGPAAGVVGLARIGAGGLMQRPRARSRIARAESDNFRRRIAVRRYHVRR